MFLLNLGASDHIVITRFVISVYADTSNKMAIGAAWRRLSLFRHLCRPHRRRRHESVVCVGPFTLRQRVWSLGGQIAIVELAISHSLTPFVLKRIVLRCARDSRGALCVTRVMM